MKRIQDTRGQTGIALVPAILIVAGLAVFSVALLSAVLSGTRSVVHQSEDYQVESAVESVAALAAEGLWSRYLREQGGAAGDIESFRGYLSAQEIESEDGPEFPVAGAGKDLLPELGLPEGDGRLRLNQVNLDAVNVVRRDVGDATQLFLTVAATTTRGDGFATPALNRAVRQVYTVEPEEFPGFEYALLANNVNCIFCHTRIDNAERWWSTSGDGPHERVKVGTLESLLLRHNDDGSAEFNEYDADSFIAGSLYTRGLVAHSDGEPIDDWGALSFQSYLFDVDGNLVEGSLGLELNPFSPAGSSQDPLENLYLDYALAYSEQGDGYLPDHFPSPFPDDGGLDPSTGEFDATGAGNRRVDDAEFYDVAQSAIGEITAGVVNVSDSTDPINTSAELVDAVTLGNRPDGLRSGGGEGVAGNVILTGTRENPIHIEGTLAIDGDLVIQGYVKGTGSLYVRGNIYIPSDLVYADGQSYLPGDLPGNPTGPRTFGFASDGTANALALTAGGNVLIGDYQRPSTLQPDGTYQEPGTNEIINGSSSGDWNFPLSEVAIFNRGEWAKTQATLPGPLGSVVANPGYVPGYVPRYYGFDDGTTIPIFNRGVYYDPSSGTWLGLETPISWDPTYLTYADPRNPADPLLFNPDGTPRAVTSTLAHTDNWFAPGLYKAVVEYSERVRAQATPLQLDGLLYTNNAIFSIVYRNSAYAGMMLMNGSIVAPDVGMLVPGRLDRRNRFPNHSSLSDYAIGLQLNYDRRLKDSLDIQNPFQVQLKRTYWNPTANVL